MILPTRTLSPSRSLLGIGAEILRLLDQPKGVSRLWTEYRDMKATIPNTPRIPFGWFVLALDLLYVLGAVEYKRRRLVKARHDSQNLEQPPDVQDA